MKYLVEIFCDDKGEFKDFIKNDKDEDNNIDFDDLIQIFNSFSLVVTNDGSDAFLLERLI